MTEDQCTAVSKDGGEPGTPSFDNLSGSAAQTVSEFLESQEPQPVERVLVDRLACQLPIPKFENPGLSHLARVAQGQAGEILKEEYLHKFKYIKNSEMAMAELGKLRWKPKQGQNVPLDESAILPYVDIILRALRVHFSSRDPRYIEHLVETTAWLVVIYARSLHLEGSRVPPLSDKSINTFEDKHLDFDTRVLKVEDLLVRYRGCAEWVMTWVSIPTIVNGPYAWENYMLEKKTTTVEKDGTSEDLKDAVRRLQIENQELRASLAVVSQNRDPTTEFQELKAFIKRVDERTRDTISQANMASATMKALFTKEGKDIATALNIAKQETRPHINEEPQAKGKGKDKVGVVPSVIVAETGFSSILADPGSTVIEAESVATEMAPSEVVPAEVLQTEIPQIILSRPNLLVPEIDPTQLRTADFEPSDDDSVDSSPEIASQDGSDAGSQAPNDAATKIATDAGARTVTEDAFDNHGQAFTQAASGSDTRSTAEAATEAAIETHA
ncbi:hypothetical protein P152DRAFT_262572 [Eremomyces bilateralis CBS 781.70]|uniref:Uncharacterized protein n=1 Tax=Eremomyces bilateralis CBS 781.70 TaxID=1392243 RepID=A0A6G1G8H6_9PEZI|nr:uncharacterized protein P152DRAFT_262572 [Eremomyces bilateralis CBS 781.70]KAF1814159.1 hypothetical protein P152DRAFT_262572 [Eremomyces bilateralis CBS 781.70]